MNMFSMKTGNWAVQGRNLGWTILGLALAGFLTFALQAQDAKKAGIIVENRAGARLNDKVAVLEDLVSSRVADAGFRVLSRETVVNAMNTYASPNDPKVHSLEAFRSQVDDLLSSQSSATRLAQNMGADMVLFVSLTTFGTETRDFEDKTLRLKTVNYIHTLRVSYKVLESWQGGAFTGDTITVTKTIRNTDTLHTSFNDETVNQLLDEAATLVAEGIRKRKADIQMVTADKPKLVEITIQTRMNDLVNVPITVPLMRIAPDGRAMMLDAKSEVQALDVVVELDGLSIGSAPGVFNVTPGIHKIRFSREGSKPQEMHVNCFDKQVLIVSMQMTEEAYRRWKDNLRYLQDLENDRKLTDAEVKRIEGVAKMFSESGYKVNIKEDVKKDYKADVKGFLLKGPIDR